MMTRKDYVATAEILKNWFYNHPVNTLDFEDLCGEFADMFEADNPNFNDTKFLVACGLDE
jgi:hypothetical protein